MVPPDVAPSSNLSAASPAVHRIYAAPVPSSRPQPATTVEEMRASGSAASSGAEDNASVNRGDDMVAVADNDTAEPSSSLYQQQLKAEEAEVEGLIAQAMGIAPRAPTHAAGVSTRAHGMRRMHARRDVLSLQ
jgi:hypothetical protein